MLVLVLLVAGCNVGWPQFRFGPDHQGTSGDAGIKLANTGGLIRRWSATTGGAVESSPAVSGAAVYVGSNDGRLYAYNSTTGAQLWSVVTGGPIASSPAVDSGTVYIGSGDHKLYAINADNGSTNWSVNVDATFAGLASAPMITGGQVYVSSATTLYAFNAGTGALSWSTAVGATGPLSAPSSAGAIVYVNSYVGARLFAYRADTGALLWSAAPPGTPSPSPCVPSSPTVAVANGLVYAAGCPTSGSAGASLFAYRSDTGVPVWSSGTSIASTSPAVNGGLVYVGSAAGHTLAAHDAANGAIRWTATTGGQVVSSPAAVNGVVYVGSDDQKLFAFDGAGSTGCAGSPATCTPTFSATTGGPVRSSPAVANGTVYVGSDDGTVSAFGLPSISFGKSVLQGTSSTSPSAARFGPDGRLYVAQFDGLIKAYTVARNGPNAYSVSSTETISLIQQIPNHDDSGALNPSVTTRLISGLMVSGSAANPVLYAASSDPRVGGGNSGTQTNLDTNSGIVSRLTRNGTVWQRQDLVRGLPRSEENHATNTMVLDLATNRLYVAQAGNTNMGAPSHNFNFLPEYAYSSAILRVDLNAIGTTTYDLPTLVDENYPNLQGPFGGDFGRHQARIDPSSPVQVYSPGYRNPFSLTQTRAGKLYAIDNGANAGWGDIPVNAGPGGTCTNAVNEPGGTDGDSLHLITGQGYYGGHANPTRGNRANTFNTTNPQSPVPVANPVECDPRGPSTSGALLNLNTATTGMSEYQASNFANQMNGDLLVAGYYGNVYRVKLSDDGTRVTSSEVLVSNAGTHMLDVVGQGDRDPFPGTIWAADFADGSIKVFEPADFGGTPPPPCSGAYSATLDEDRDGYTNSDEIDNATDPCSAADTPHDWNRNFVSDLHDPDDDSDGIPDTSDPFAVDPNNGLATAIPLAYDWRNGATNPCAPTPVSSGCPGGLLGLGFTGLMTNGNNYANLYDVTKMTVGGAAGVLTVDQVPAGDAYANGNSQQYGFQFGVNANPARTGVFTAHTRIMGPFTGLTPTGFQSMGLQIGTGDQDNYAKLVVSANNGSPGIEFLQEVAGSPSARPAAPVALPGPDSIDLYLTVNPTANTVQPSYRVTTGGVTGPLTNVGGTSAIPSAWLTDPGRGLAVGIIATSVGGPVFPVTWGLLQATSGAPS